MRTHIAADNPLFFGPISAPRLCPYGLHVKPPHGLGRLLRPDRSSSSLIHSSVGNGNLKPFYIKYTPRYYFTLEVYSIHKEIKVHFALKCQKIHGQGS